MASIGTYVLSSQERADSHETDPKIASAHVLKLLGKLGSVQNFGTLLSMTGYSEALLREAVENLQRDGLVESHEDGLRLTEFGKKAHLIVAT